MTKHTQIIATTLAAAIVVIVTSSTWAQDTVSASFGRERGIRAYRVVEHTESPTSTRVVAQLLDDNSMQLGEIDRTRRFREEFDAAVKGFKSFPIGDQYALRWQADRIEAVTDSQARSFRLRYNGEDLGEWPAPAGQDPRDNKLQQFIATKGELLKVAEAIQRDLDRLFPHEAVRLPR